ncbi:hypothetical protein PT974_09967 [Cladobotryum mycophilum]|uniref:Uncharacterized protein n=1 Tax=Cladobotryum mycophilum TaxID=491253 RepID=A0ABR0S8J9_9HYPO
MPYNIVFKNMSGQNAQYSIFMAPPDFSGNEQLWMTVWYTTTAVWGGSFEINVNDDSFVWSGTVPTKPAQYAVVATSGYEILDLGTDTTPGDAFTLVLNPVSSFDFRLGGPPSAPTGSFQLSTYDDIPTPNNTYLAGFARAYGKDNVNPVAVFAPGNHEVLQITPKMKFFVNEAFQQPGEIVNQEDVEANGVTIDFEVGDGAGKTFAKVVHNGERDFTVTYSDAPE